MKRVITLALFLVLASVCWGQIVTRHATSSPPNPYRMINWLTDGSWSKPWDAYWIYNVGTQPVVITAITFPANFSITQPNGDNNCTNLGPHYLIPGGGCLLYVSYQPKAVGHTIEGWLTVHLTDMVGNKLPPYRDLIFGYGCPKEWTQFQCLTFNAGW